LPGSSRIVEYPLLLLQPLLKSVLDSTVMLRELRNNSQLMLKPTAYSRRMLLTSTLGLYRGCGRAL
jgi:hypothetical protein